MGIGELLHAEKVAFEARDWDMVSSLQEEIDRWREGKASNSWVCMEGASYGPVTRDEAEIIADQWQEETGEPVWIEDLG